MLAVAAMLDLPPRHPRFVGKARPAMSASPSSPNESASDVWRMKKDKRSTLDRVRQAAMEAGASRRSPLRRWMEDNRESFAKTLAEAGSRPNWTAIARVLAEDGLKDADGNPPTAKTATQTWWKVNSAPASSRRRKPEAHP